MGAEYKDFRVSFYASKPRRYENKKFSFAVYDFNEADSIINKFEHAGNKILAKWITLPVFDIQIQVNKSVEFSKCFKMVSFYYRAVNKMYEVIKEH